MNTSKTIQYPHRRRPGRERPRLLQRTKLVYGAAFGIAAAGALALVAASVLGSHRSSRVPAVPASALPSSTLFEGVSQRGNAAGLAGAPVTLVEYADLQCPFCGSWAREQLPPIVHRLVRTGRLRIEFHGLAFVGPDSNTALAGALAAARQNRLWSFIDAMYVNQGAENAGWVDGALAGAVAAAGLDQARWETDRLSGAVLDEIDRLGQDAKAIGVTSTPSFAIARTGDRPQLLSTHNLDPLSLVALVDRLAPR